MAQAISVHQSTVYLLASRCSRPHKQQPMLHDQDDHVFTLAACKPDPELPSEACREKVVNGTIGCRHQVLLSFQTGSKPEILSMIAQTAASLTRLKPVRNDRSISLSSKIRLMRSLVTSILLCTCESWTLTAELQRRIQAMEMRSYRKIPRVLYEDHITNEESAPRSSWQSDHTKT